MGTLNSSRRKPEGNRLAVVTGGSVCSRAGPWGPRRMPVSLWVYLFLSCPPTCCISHLHFPVGIGEPVATSASLLLGTKSQSLPAGFTAKL